MGKVLPNIHPFEHTYNMELFSHLNCLTLCMTRFWSLGINLIQTSRACKYEVTSASSCAIAFMIQYPPLRNPHYLVPPKVHPQNIPTGT
jgi:hypothetical protein